METGSATVVFLLVSSVSTNIKPTENASNRTPRTQMDHEQIRSLDRTCRGLLNLVAQHHPGLLRQGLLQKGQG